VLSSRASSHASSARLNQCCTKYILSMRSSPMGGRRRPGRTSSRERMPPIPAADAHAGVRLRSAQSGHAWMPTEVFRSSVQMYICYFVVM
jgi:hypothetical protein